MEWDKVFIALLVLNFAFIGYTYFEIQKSNQKMDIGCEACKMYNLSKNGIQGLYNPNTYTYCVNMKGRTEAEINDTDKHEYCHLLIDLDFDNHFCKEKN